MNAELMPAAERFIRRLIRMSGNPSSIFRLRVKPGGCSGLSAEFDLETVTPDGDQIWEVNGLRIALDTESAKLVDGCIVNFVDALANTGFTFLRPGEASSCCSSIAPPQLVSLSSRLSGS